MRPPVVLVHGYLADSNLMRPMQWRLQKRGFDAHVVELPPGAIQDVNVLANELAWNVERVLRTTGARQVDLVGVSLGGIIGLAYAQQSAHLGQVRRIVAVGTPWLGSPIATAMLPLMGLFSRGIRQMYTGAPMLRGLLRRGLPTGVQAVSISMRGDLLAPPGRCVLPGARNIVLGGYATPFTHQWLIMSNGALDEVVGALGDEG